MMSDHKLKFEPAAKSLVEKSTKGTAMIKVWLNELHRAGLHS